MRRALVLAALALVLTACGENGDAEETPREAPAQTTTGPETDSGDDY
jgi:hypothetical protein